METMEAEAKGEEERFDEQGRLIVPQDRDKPPLDKGCAHALFIKIEGGVLYVAGVLDMDPNKGGDHTLPGGRIKGRAKGHPETAIETAVEEAKEEAGVQKKSADTLNPSHLTADDLSSVCYVIAHDEPLRDECGDPLPDPGTGRQQRGPLVHFMFACAQGVGLRQTTDRDTGFKEPAWFTLPEIVEKTHAASEIRRQIRSISKRDEERREERENLKKALGEASRDGAWSIKHIILVLTTLSSIGKGYADFRRDLITDPRDVMFYRSLERYERESYHNHYLLEDWAADNVVNDIVLDPEAVLIEIMGERDAMWQLHRKGAARFEFNPLPASEYFGAQSSKEDE